MSPETINFSNATARNLKLRDNDAAAEDGFSAPGLKSPRNQEGLWDCSPEKKLADLSLPGKQDTKHANRTFMRGLMHSQLDLSRGGVGHWDLWQG